MIFIKRTYYITLNVVKEFLFENGRIDNVFTDAYFDGFTTALHEVNNVCRGIKLFYFTDSLGASRALFETI